MTVFDKPELGTIKSIVFEHYLSYDKDIGRAKVTKLTEDAERIMKDKLIEHGKWRFIYHAPRNIIYCEQL